MASSESLLLSLLRAYADASGDLDLRTFIGTPGYRIEVRNETVDTGQGYEEPSFVTGLIRSVGGMLDRARQDEFDVTNPLGQSSFTLSYAPRSTAHLLVFQDGTLLKKTAWSLSGTSLTLAVAAPMGAWLLASYWY